MAGQDIASLFQSLMGTDTAAQFDSPDSNVVRNTNDNHPMPQCRLDTYFNGALCDVDHEEEFDDIDPTVGHVTGQLMALQKLQKAYLKMLVQDHFAGINQRLQDCLLLAFNN